MTDTQTQPSSDPKPDVLDEARKIADEVDDGLDAFTGDGGILPPPWNYVVKLVDLIRKLIDVVDDMKKRIKGEAPTPAASAATGVPGLDRDPAKS